VVATQVATACDTGDDKDGNDNADESSDTCSEYPSFSNHDNLDGPDLPIHNEQDVFTQRNGFQSCLFEALFQTLSLDPNKYRAPSSMFSGSFGPLVCPECDHPPAVSAFIPYVDDGTFLLQQDQVSTFEQRARLLYINWDVLHACETIQDIKRWWESLVKEDHLLLVHLYSAYWVTTPVATESFGRTKAKFWNAVNHEGAFIHNAFVVTHDVPLASVTVEFFLMRSVKQWVQFLSRYQLTVFNIWDVLSENVSGFVALNDTVHPRYNVLIANFCSDAYRIDGQIEFMLQRQLSLTDSTRLSLTTVDANILISSNFPALYEVASLQSSDGLHLLRRAHSFMLQSPTPLQLSSECNDRWLRLVACWLLPLDIDVSIMTNAMKVLALVSVSPPSYTNDTLRCNYPTLLQQPSYVLREFLGQNALVLRLYGKLLPSYTYGRLRLQLMGCVVAILQDLYNMVNIDSKLSRSDIFFIITHVGGILHSSQQPFASGIFNIFDTVDVDIKLA
jgi:uncharacterized protein YbaR (Trm112 family)